ncbi:hypothetical protein J8281_14785 [Aquimarina sp. U1-2]|uniref:tetratricopeptide repeat protein n=1 Tax=Aquimarina sp. U1-2 TaxID=2823141 RepID=UPI001AEC93C7|nr:hypothetical protein [Aquimarina sp. U1-2]MBP2833459.1 hypothetical protein [Aquimarina sp. U1-2]
MKFLNINYVVLICYLIKFPFYGQEASIVRKKDSLKIYHLLSEAKKLSRRNLDSAEYDARQALHFAEMSGSPKFKADALRILSIVLGEKGGKEDQYCALTYNEDAYALYKQLQDTTGIVASLNNSSILYRHLNQYPESIEAITTAISYITSTTNIKNYNNVLGKSYGVLGNIYRNINLKDSAIANFERAKVCFQKTGSVYQYHVALNTGIVYSRDDDFKKAREYYLYAYNGYVSRGDSVYIASSACDLGKVYIQLDSLEVSRKFYSQAIEISRKKSLHRRLVRGLIGKGEITYREGEYNKALAYVDTTIPILDTFNFVELKYYAYELKGRLLRELGDTKQAIIYTEKATRIDDSLRKAKNQPAITASLLKINDQEQNKKLKVFENVIYHKTKWIWILTLTILLILFLLFRFYKKSKMQLANLIGSISDLKNSLIKSNKKQEHVSRKLVSTSANNALKSDLLLQIDGLLTQVKTKIVKKNDPLKVKIEETQSNIKYQASVDKIWEDFFAHFREVHPNFLETLNKRHKLTPNDLKICAYIKMNLTPKEIASLMNVTPNSIRITIHRLKKKMKLPKDTSVFDFIKTLEIDN